MLGRQQYQQFTNRGNNKALFDLYSSENVAILVTRL